MKLSAREQQQSLRCAVCRDGSGTLATCNGCGSQWHVECVDGSCPTLGCGSGGEVKEKKVEAKPRWFGQRFSPGEHLDGDCAWCALPEDLHAGTDHYCPVNTLALQEMLGQERAESVQILIRMNREHDEQRVFRAKVWKFGIAVVCVLLVILAMVAQVILRSDP